MIYMFLSNNPSYGDINSSNLSCYLGNADQDHNEVGRIMAISRETPTFAMSTTAQKWALASTSTNLQPTSYKGIL